MIASILHPLTTRSRLIPNPGCTWPHPFASVAAGGLEVTDYEADRRVGFRSVSGPVQLRGTFTFEPANGGTRISLAAEVQAGGLFKMAEGLMVRQARKMWEADMATLKGIMEG